MWKEDVLIMHESWNRRHLSCSKTCNAHHLLGLGETVPFMGGRRGDMLLSFPLLYETIASG